MTTESSESGRAGLVSGGLGIFAFPNGEADSVGPGWGSKKKKVRLGRYSSALFVIL